MNFSDRLKLFRRKNAITQSQLAEILGVSSNYIGILESGRAVDESTTLAKFFGELEGIASSGARGRLKLARKIAGISQADLAKKIGYSIGVLQAIEDGTARISESMAEKLEAALPSLSKFDLMEGSDHPTVLGNQESTLGKKPDIIMPPGMTARYVPLISWAQAGAMASFEDEVYEYEGQLAFDVTDPKAFAVKIRGDSMSPQYTEGDVVILYPSSQPKNGDLVIARLDDEHGNDVMFKIFSSAHAGRSVKLSSYNPAYPQMEFDRKDFAWIYPAASVVKHLKH